MLNVTATGCPQHELGTACATFLAQSQPLCKCTSLASFLLTPDDRTASGTSIQHMRRETDRHRGTSSAEHVAQVPVCQDANAGSRSLPTRCCFQGSCRVLHSRLRRLSLCEGWFESDLREAPSERLVVPIRAFGSVAEVFVNEGSSWNQQ